MDAQTIKWYISYVCEDVNVKQIESLAKAKKDFFGDLLTEETILKLVAAELGVNIQTVLPPSCLKVKDLVEGLSDVTITLTVKEVGEPRGFERLDGSRGKVLTIHVYDETGTLNLVAWNEKINLISALQTGQTIKVTHTYTRKNAFGEIELHLGRHSNVAKL
jgi:replication factor A1